MKAGTAIRLLCLPLALALLEACGHDAQPKPQAQAQKPNEAEEMFQVVEATKNNPSLRANSNLAGPPIHVDPYPKPLAKGQDAEHAHHNMMNH